MRKTSIRRAISLAVMALFIAGSTLQGSAAENAVGRKVENFSLRDFRGKTHSLDDFRDSKLVVLAFLGNDCPLAKLYGPRLQQLADKYHGQGVAFVGINSNRQDVPTAVDAYARKHGITFPILKDLGNEIADALGALRTPEVFVLDNQRQIRYRGRIDDQYGVTAKREAAERHDLAAAIDELLAGKDVTVSLTEAPGCRIGKVRDVEPHGDVTYSNQISRVLNKHCLECHRNGEIAPFPLTNFEEVVGWSETILEVVQDGRMPPWFADPKFGKFSNDCSLNQQDKELLATWVANGSPEGDKAELPAAPQFVEGWRMEKPDVVFHMDEEFDVPAEGTVDYVYFIVDPKLKEDAWVQMSEARPGNPSVVHHILVYSVPGEHREMAERVVARQKEKGVIRKLDAKGKRAVDGSREIVETPFGALLALYAPGMNPWVYPDGAAMKIEKDSFFIIQMHYTPNGTAQKDRSYVGIKYADPSKVKQTVKDGSTINPAIRIPPYAANHQEMASVTFPVDVMLLNMFPHMHYRGKSFRFEAEYPDGNKEVLLDVPRYDFNWQLRYDLVEPKKLPKGTKLVTYAVFDNSEENLANPDPSQTVRFGLQTWEEMLAGYFTVIPLEEIKSRRERRREQREKKEEPAQTSENK